MLMPPGRGCHEPLSQPFVRALVSDEHYQALLDCETEAVRSSSAGTFQEQMPEPMKTCPLCMEEVPASKTISLGHIDPDTLLSNCEHFLCVDCLQGGLTAMLGSEVADKDWVYDDAYAKLKQAGGRIRCRMLCGAECDSELHQQLIMRHVRKDLFDRYLNMEVTGDMKKMSMVTCPACGGAIDIGGFVPAVRCPYRRGCPDFCSGCKLPSHEGKTCQQVADENLANNDIAQAGIKMTTCPKCMIPCEAKTEVSCDRVSLFPPFHLFVELASSIDF